MSHQHQINRLKVFSALKAYMTQNGECPTAVELANYIHPPLATSTILRHMRALHRADGLPLPVTIRPHSRQVFDQAFLPTPVDRLPMSWGTLGHEDSAS